MSFLFYKMIDAEDKKVLGLEIGMRFTKMHGLGNDYLYHFGALENVEKLAIQLSDRHFGIGSDGIITIETSDRADFKMRIFNADGSEAMMCGNGIRCVGKYVYEKHYTDKTTLKIDTLSGIKILNLVVENGVVTQVTVDMGKAVVDKEKTVTVLGKEVSCIPVSTGNPHAVVFCENAEEAPLTTIGAAMEKHPDFPGGVNVEFVSKVAENELRMRVWERGSGITMACGTGTCASVAAAITAGMCAYEKPVTVHLDGGDLSILIHKDHTVFMTGPAATVCECEV